MSCLNRPKRDDEADQLHVRNEHANLQYRINGIILPDGVSGFGQVLETQFVGSLSLVTGALPAEYGYRTSGLVDIQTKSGSQDPGGSIGVYGGSQKTLTPSIEYGGTRSRNSRAPVKRAQAEIPRRGRLILEC